MARPLPGCGMNRFLCLLVAVLIGSADTSAAAPDCEGLAERAAQDEGVPPGVLSAIARVESGRTVDGRFRAWPWTLNQGGRGSYHADKDAALAALKDLLAAGVHNVDVGCMQINWHWHADAFPDLTAMMDPAQNTRYAARFLRTLHDQHGDWSVAIRYYHSADPGRGAAYARRVDQHMAALQEGIQDTAPPVAPVVRHQAERPAALVLGPGVLAPGAQGMHARASLLAGGAGALVDLRPLQKGTLR